MADTTVGSRPALPLNQHRYQVFTTALIGYSFAADNTSRDVVYYKTTDGGSTWAAAVTVTAGTCDVAEVWFDQWTPGDNGTKIHIAYSDNTNNDIRYKNLNTSGDTLSSESVIFDGVSIGLTDQRFSIAKMRGGNLVCAYDIDNGTESGAAKSTDGGATWSAIASPYEGATSDQALIFCGNEVDANDAWLAFWDASADEITLKTYDDSLDSWSESAAQSGAFESIGASTGKGWSGAVRHSDNHLILVYANDRDVATSDLKCLDINGASSIVVKTDVFSNADDWYNPVIFIDQSVGDLYVAYNGKSDGTETLGTSTNIYYRISRDGADTWSAATLVSSGAGDLAGMTVTMGGLATLFLPAWSETTTFTVRVNPSTAVSFSLQTGLIVEIDWANDGSFTSANDDITGDVLSIQTSRGRDFASHLIGESSAGTLTATLLNTTGKYSAFNTGSPIYGDILPGRNVRVRMETPVNKAIWTGYLQRIEPDVQTGPYNTARLYAQGGIGLLGATKVNPAANSGDNTGDLVTAVLNAANWPASKRQIDAGNTTTGAWYITDANPLDAIRELEDAESGFFYEAANGDLVFEGRYYRPIASRSVTSQVTFSDAPAATYGYMEISQSDPLAQIYNSVQAEVRNYSTAALAVLWTFQGTSPTLSPGESKTFIAVYPSATAGTTGAYVNAWTTPVVATDVTQTGGVDGNLAVSAVKAATQMEITLTNNGGTVMTLTLIRARGTAVTVSDPVLVKANNVTSQADYGVRTYPFPSKWLANINDAQALSDFVVDSYGEARPVLTLTFAANKSTAMLTQMISREISDRVTIVAANNAELGINEDFFIESISHSIDSGGLRHMTTMQFSPASAGISGPFWVLGTSELGVDTVLGF